MQPNAIAAAVCVSFSLLLLTGAVAEDEEVVDGVCSVDETGNSDCCAGNSCQKSAALLHGANVSSAWLPYVNKIEREWGLAMLERGSVWVLDKAI